VIGPVALPAVSVGVVLEVLHPSQAGAGVAGVPVAAGAVFGTLTVFIATAGLPSTAIVIPRAKIPPRIGPSQSCAKPRRRNPARQRTATLQRLHIACTFVGQYFP
jgi:hypothetical protein